MRPPDLFAQPMRCANCGADLGIAYLETIDGLMVCCGPCGAGHPCTCTTVGATDPGIPLPDAIRHALETRKRGAA